MTDDCLRPRAWFSVIPDSFPTRFRLDVSLIPTSQAPTSGKAPSRHPILPERQPTSRLRMLAFLRRSSWAARLLPTVKPFCKTPRERVHFSVVVQPGAVCQSIFSSLEDSKGAQKQPIKKRQTTQSQGAYFFSLAACRSAGHTRYLFGSSVYHQAGGKIGEQVTDAAAGVMVKLAPKIGLSTRDLVYCSTEAAKVLWRDWWDFCQDTVDLKRICWYFVGKWICNLKMDFLRNSMLREVFEFYW